MFDRLPEKGSCTNGRIEDLRTVAAIVRGKRVAPGVRAMVVPGSGSVRRAAEEEGIAQTLIDAGFEWREPGCSMCLAMNDDVLAPGERCASTTNRNFEGRQGRYSNAMNNRLLLVQLDRDSVDALTREAIATPGTPISIDLERQTVRSASDEQYAYPIGARHKRMVIDGMDTVDLTLDSLAAIEAFEQRHFARHPWAQAM
ncbi:hypothetical protein FSB08_30185 [Paraburkholderia sp. JPY432]|nr:hypothetical protein [Paraburkholderia youngii]